MRKLSKIIIHCSGTPEGKDLSAGQIRQWHVDVNKWSDIGYHFIVDRSGRIEPGRPVHQIGAHCRGHNADSIGICYVGGLSADGSTPKDTRTPAQRAAIVELVKSLKDQYGSHITVHGHNELTCRKKADDSGSCHRRCAECRFALKACPSFSLKYDPELCAL